MAIQKFALYDLIVDIIPGAILLLILYSVVPEGVYQQFFGINQSIVPGILVLLSYPFGRIVVHGASSGLEDQLLYIMSTKEPSEIGDAQLENWFANPDTTPSGVSLSVVQDVQVGLRSIAGLDTNPKALRRYGENILFPRDTLYGKYEILATFYRHMTFVSILSLIVYMPYILLHLTGRSILTSVNGPAPISGLPHTILLLIPIVAIISLFLCQRQWQNRNKSKNRAFVNDLHTYLREQNLINRTKEE